MCGLIGIVGSKPVAVRLIDALQRLDYRGYDSAGIATIHDEVMARRRAPGKLRNLRQCHDVDPIDGNTGLGHTRWATHGPANETNAHPHVVGDVCIVHNGIIENFFELRRELEAEGAIFETATDTEVAAHLMANYLDQGLEPFPAMLAMLGRLRGSYAIAIMLRHHPAMMMAARSGPPLAIGHGRGEMFFGSDAIALASFTDRITYLDNGDCAVITRDSALIFDFQGHPVVRPHRVVQTAAYLADKGNHRHFMEKEIAEQPETISHLLGNYIDFASRTVKVDHDIDFSSISGLLISGCGTAYLSGCIGKYWFERHAGIVVETDYASEFRYRDVPFFPRQAALFISQSGETADTLAALHYCIENGVMTGAVVNVAESTLGRDADALFPTLAGPEIGVASTKAFTCQLAVLACLAVAAGRARGTIDAVQEASMVGNLIEVPRLMGEVLTKMRPHVEDLAAQIAQCRNILYIGRGTSFPLAMEGALKLKEITYIHAEGYAAGELKHGPIALVDEAMPVVVIAPFDRFFEKTVSNMQEVAARGGRIILITDERGAAQSSLPTMGKIVLPDMEEFISPILFALPLQMLAYHTAAIMGTDVDQPRNLAKSVTVE